MAQIRQRKQQTLLQKPESGSVAVTATALQSPKQTMDFLRRQPLWIVLAVASGTCAAFNGVFAKLTTTALTSTLAASVATILGLPADNAYVNYALRAMFFGLNVTFNIAMWALFTAALAKGNSTTRVSVINVSSNFFITAILGAMIFGEKLPLGWWMGAGLLAAGNVVIGRREEPKTEKQETEAEEEQEVLLSQERDHSLELRTSADLRRSERERVDNLI